METGCESFMSTCTRTIFLDVCLLRIKVGKSSTFFGLMEVNFSLRPCPLRTKVGREFQRLSSTTAMCQVQFREYESWQQLRWFVASNNRLSGTLPPQFGNVATIFRFVASNNSLSGPLPSSFKKWSIVDGINLAFNNLTGTIPADWGGEMKVLTTLILPSNQLSGSIPLNLLTKNSLVVLMLGYNQLVGRLSSSMNTNLVVLDVQHNVGLRGSLPKLFAFSFFRPIVTTCGTGTCATITTALGLCIPRDQFPAFIASSQSPINIISGFYEFKQNVSCHPSVLTSTATRDLEYTTDGNEEVLPLLQAAAAPKAFVAVATLLDPLSGVALIALSSGRCASDTQREVASYNRLLLSPFYALGPGAAVLGNIGLCATVLLLHYGCVHLSGVTTCAGVQRRRPLRTSKNRTTPPTLAARLKFPHLSITLVLFLSRGIAFYGATRFAAAIGEDNFDDYIPTSGSLAIGVVLISCILICSAWAVGRHRIDPSMNALHFETYRQKTLRRLRWMPPWMLPIGQWKPDDARLRYGALRGPVAGGSERLSLLTESVSIGNALLAGAVPGTKWGCVGQALGQCCLLIAASLSVILLRPMRVPLGGHLLCATWIVQVGLNVCMVAHRVWDSDIATAIALVLTTVHTVTGILSASHRIAIVYWERRESVPSDFVTSEDRTKEVSPPLLITQQLHKGAVTLRPPTRRSLGTTAKQHTSEEVECLLLRNVEDISRRLQKLIELCCNRRDI
ncbi:GP46-like surface antigen, putative [Bodo saltans]|uniref:GP46-like surface antigen, putative n=1 Tax=Bodo saltans TaxID=75058 RepID=A0A0S4JE78_BODSA|nr:GP46-like surface antigen, putative [Bodo saltans]|eukprot:CUG88596.1 GP46-like surface antigen, putative [Bodo saltans]